MFWPTLDESLTYESTNVTTVFEEKNNIKETRKFKISPNNVKHNLFILGFFPSVFRIKCGLAILIKGILPSNRVLKDHVMLTWASQLYHSLGGLLLD